MKKYVLGLMFDVSGERVVLIEKTKPEWQAGKLNGVGGKVEPGEHELDAMVREFEEETGVAHVMWEPFIHLVGTHQDTSPWEIFIYRCFTPKCAMVRTTTEERVVLSSLNFVDLDRCVRNLRWLLPMAADRQVCGPKNSFIEMDDRSGF